MPKTYPTINSKKIEFSITECNLTFASSVIEHGRNLYIKLPKSQADYYEIMSGDTVKITIHELRRAREETEK